MFANKAIIGLYDFNNIKGSYGSEYLLPALWQVALSWRSFYCYPLVSLPKNAKKKKKAKNAIRSEVLCGTHMIWELHIIKYISLEIEIDSGMI